MDALSRFWCELVRLKSLALEASDFDQGNLGPKSSHPLWLSHEATKDRFDWMQEPGFHFDYYPPPGLLGELLAEHNFAAGNDGERLPEMEELARLAAEDRIDPDRSGAIWDAIQQVKNLLRYLSDRDGRWLCDCESCLKIKPTVWWHDITCELNRSFNTLGRYIPSEWREYDGVNPWAEEQARARQKAGGRPENSATAKAKRLIDKAVKKGDYNRTVIAEKTGLSPNHVSKLKSEIKRPPLNGKSLQN